LRFNLHGGKMSSASSEENVVQALAKLLFSERSKSESCAFGRNKGTKHETNVGIRGEATSG